MRGGRSSARFSAERQGTRHHDKLYPDGGGDKNGRRSAGFRV